jgi:putative AbiEii toxin of type IV toxin-antitoxin system
VRISTQNRYGPLQAGFAFDLEKGYKVLIGRNNSGKSAILQLVFKTLMRDGSFGAERLCILLTDRDYVQPSTETGGMSLAAFNQNVHGPVDGTPMQHSTRSIDWSILPRLLLNHTNTLKQIDSLNKLLVRAGLPDLVLRTSQLIHFEDIPVPFQGSGLRSLLGLLAALTDTQISVLLIDEPELSLEPGIQRILRDMLIEFSQSKQILIATHSHLFLNRADPSSNLLVQRQGDIVSLSPVASVEQLYDLTFELLGNSTEDLFFPANFMVVEGSSDQVIVEKVRNLLGVPASRLKVLSATGVENIPATVAAVHRVLVPVVMRDSPYAQRVVAMVDQPVDPALPVFIELQRILGSRLFVLDRSSIEEYVPEAIYSRIGRNKAEDIKRIADLKDKQADRSALKKALSQQIASGLTSDDLQSLSVIVNAVRKAE